MKKFLLIVLVLLFTVGCQGFSLDKLVGANSGVQEFAYKDIVKCVKVPDAPNLSDCTIKIDKEGSTIVVRFKTSEIPAEPTQEVK